MLFVETRVCPVCKADRARSTVDESAFSFDEGLAYLAPLIESESPDFYAALEDMKPFRCGNCNSRFLDPWLSLEGRARIFVTGHPVHNAGWRHFVERLERNLTPDLQVDAEQLIDYMNSRTKGLEQYIELGCPFQGLLLHLAERATLEQYRGCSSRISGMLPQHRRRLLTPLRLFMRASSVGRNLALSVSRVRTARDKLRGRHKSDPTVSLRGNTSFKKSFVPLGSTRFWGVNCSMFGETCTATALTALGAQVTPFEEFRRIKRMTHGSIGLFNVLDHQENPLELLRLCLEKATLVIVLGHEPPLGIQHQFGIGSDFMERLPELISGASVERLSKPESVNFLFAISLEA